MLKSHRFALLALSTLPLLRCSPPPSGADASTDAPTATDDVRDVPSPMDVRDPVDRPDPVTDVPSAMDAADVVALNDVTSDTTSDASSDVPNMMFGPCVAPMNIVANAALAAPRLLSPLSGGVVSTARPSIQWQLPAGVTGGRVEFCSNRDCTTIVAAFESDSSRVRPNCNLPAGTNYFRVRAKSGAMYGMSTSPVWQLRVPSVIPNANAADTVLRMDADFNGDGLADIATNRSEGMATVLFQIVFGRRPGVPATPNLNAMNLGLTAPSLIGDIDGDGYVDMAMQAPGGVALYFGSSMPAQIITRTQMVVAAGPATGFGSVIAPAGDVDGDGYADLLIGAPLTQVGAASSAGRVFFVRGGPGALTSTVLTEGTTALEQAGAGLTAGDSNGDGSSEVLVGSPFAGANRTGSIAVFQWNAMMSQLTRTSTLTLQPEGLNQHLGRAISMWGDNNGDGIADLVASASEFQVMANTVGAIGWKAGSAMGLSGSLAQIAQGMADQPVGARVVQMGDLNNDGYGDLAFAQPTFNAGMGVIGQYRFFRGGAMGAPTELLPSIRGDVATMTQAGTILAGIGDFDGDNIDDMALVLGQGGANPMTSLQFARGGVWPPTLMALGSGSIFGIASSN